MFGWFCYKFSRLALSIGMLTGAAVYGFRNGMKVSERVERQFFADYIREERNDSTDQTTKGD